MSIAVFGTVSRCRMVFSIAWLEQWECASCATGYVCLAVGSQAVRNTAGAARGIKGIQHNSGSGWAGTATDFPSSPQAQAAWGRIRAVCPAGIWPPSAGTCGRRNRSFRTGTAQNPALCPLGLILPSIHSVYSQEIMDFNVEVLKYIDVTISRLFSLEMKCGL